MLPCIHSIPVSIYAKMYCTSLLSSVPVSLPTYLPLLCRKTTSTLSLLPHHLSLSQTSAMPLDNKRKREDTPTGSDVPDPPPSIFPNLPQLPPPPQPASTQKSRPKRARTKQEKKIEQENTSRFHCDFCARDLSFAVRARCAVCPDYDSCLDCFSVGAALVPHKPEHAYRLIQVILTPIFQIGWFADEEEKMLEGLELYGVGNWEQVAKLITTKSPLETEQHFMKVFLQSSTAPLADPAVMVPAEKIPVSEKYDDVDPKRLRVMHMHQQEDAAGWMEKRKDFVYEWDNEAEDIIGDMEVNDDDTKPERDLKAQVLEIYAKKLDQREIRKRFVHERGLTNFKEYQIAEKKRPKDEKELRDKLRVFARFMSPVDLEKLVKGILDERQLRARIDILRDGRALGARTIEECQRIAANQAKSKNRKSEPQTEPSNLSGSQTTSQRRHRRTNGEHSTSDPASMSNGTSAPGTTVADSKDKKSSTVGDVDLEKMPGAELMSKTEIGLCEALKITPHQFLIVKEVLVRENARTGCLKKKDAKQMVRLDSAKVLKIYDYLHACGWIRTGANTNGGAARNALTSNGSKT